jgi:hypothetical protein
VADERPARGCDPTNTHRGSHDQRAKETCRRMIEETQKRADILLEMAQQQALEIIARAHEGTPTGEG